MLMHISSTTSTRNLTLRTKLVVTVWCYKKNFFSVSVPVSVYVCVNVCMPWCAGIYSQQGLTVLGGWGE